MVYPNPAKGKLWLVIKDEINHEVDIQILNSMGLIIDEVKIDKSSFKDSKVEVDISNYSSGVYYIRYTSDKIQHVQKFIKY